MWIAIEVPDEAEQAVRTCLSWLETRAYLGAGEMVIVAPAVRAPAALEHQLAVRLNHMIILGKR